MPPTPDGELKFCRDVSFTNSIHHSASGQTISVNTFTSGDSQWATPANVPPALQQELYTVMQGIYGHEADGLTLDSFRLCWYVLARPFLPFPLPRCMSCLSSFRPPSRAHTTSMISDPSSHRTTQGRHHAFPRPAHNRTPSLPEPLPRNGRLVPWLEVSAYHW